MNQQSFQRRASNGWNQLLSTFGKVQSSYVRFDSGVGETVIYKAEQTHSEDANIPLLQSTIQKLIVEDDEYKDKEVEYALQLIRNVS
jgi:hypothetical protein